MWNLLLLASPTDASPFNLTQLGVFSIVAVLLLAVVRYLLAQGEKKDRRIEELAKRLDELQQARIADRDAQAQRDEVRSERVVALLTQTATVLEQTATALEATPRQFERALGTAREASSRAEVDDTLRQVRQMVTDMERRWAAGGPESTT